jgi:hypothetical protein
MPALALVVVVGCGGGDPAPPVTDPVQALRAEASAGASYARPWTTLRDVLPHVTYASVTAGQQSRERITDSAVVGRVVSTDEAHGMLGEPLVAGEDVRSRVVAFDDDRAAWRVLSVTLQVSETLAGPPVDELVVDWYLRGPDDGGDDAGTASRALRDLGTIVLLSKAHPDRPEFVPGRAAVPMGYGVGRVASDGTLSFPLIAPDESPSAEVFLDGVDTLTELRTEARTPPRTVLVEPA